MANIRSENECINDCIDQLVWGVQKLGWDLDDWGETVLRACDMVLTEEEWRAYPEIMRLVKIYSPI